MPERKEYLLRIDARLIEEIKKWASQELRSVNGQIEYILKAAVDKRKNSGTS